MRFRITSVGSIELFDFTWQSWVSVVQCQRGRSLPMGGTHRRCESADSGGNGGPFELNPKELQLNVPPTVVIFPGVIVCFDSEGGIEIVDRLPQELSGVTEQTTDGEIFDIAEVREQEGSSPLSRLLRNRTPLPTRAGVEVVASNVRRLSLEVQDPTRFAVAFRASPRPSKRSAKSENHYSSGTCLWDSSPLGS